MSENISLCWQQFASHGKDVFRELMVTQNYSDVTLVTEDQHQFKAHKFILSGCSSVFRNILEINPQNMSIFLRGVQHQELESILQFIYLGETTIHQNLLTEFFNVSKDLDIKEISGCSTSNDYEMEIKKKTESITTEEDNKMFPDFLEVSMQQNDDIDVNEETETALSLESEKLFPDFLEVPLQQEESISPKSKKKFEPIKISDTLWECSQCDKKLTTQIGIKIHMKATHEDKKYKCPQCDHQATQAGNLRLHIQAVHEGIKYPCQQCNHKATTLSNLKSHIMSKHLNAKYQCKENNCDYQTTSNSGLSHHVKVKHDHIKLPKVKS